MITPRSLLLLSAFHPAQAAETKVLTQEPGRGQFTPREVACIRR